MHKLKIKNSPAIKVAKPAIKKDRKMDGPE